MSLTLHYHPLSSFCHKVRFGLYERGIEPALVQVNLMTEAGRAAFNAMWPPGKMPVLQDGDVTLGESTIILEHIDARGTTGATLFPSLEARLWDRIFDTSIHVHMQKIVSDKQRSFGHHDATGVEEATATIQRAYDMAERHLAGRTFLAGDALSVADCAALPVLFFGEAVVPYATTHPNLAAYFTRLYARPTAQRIYAEARPFLKYFPYVDHLPARLRGA